MVLAMFFSSKDIEKGKEKESLEKRKNHWKRERITGKEKESLEKQSVFEEFSTFSV
jgi:hypothetical protein